MSVKGVKVQLHKACLLPTVPEYNCPLSPLACSHIDLGTSKLTTTAFCVEIKHSCIAWCIINMTVFILWLRDRRAKQEGIGVVYQRPRVWSPFMPNDKRVVVLAFTLISPWWLMNKVLSYLKPFCVTHSPLKCCIDLSIMQHSNFQ